MSEQTLQNELREALRRLNNLQGDFTNIVNRPRLAQLGPVKDIEDFYNQFEEQVKFIRKTLLDVKGFIDESTPQ